MEWSIVVGAVCAALGGVIGYATFYRNKEKDSRADGQQTGVVLTELGYIKGSMDGLNRKMDRQEERNLEIVTRVTALESSAKQAHHRIDRLEGRTE